MDWSGAIVQWLHIFCGTFWFGGTLFTDFIVLPALMALPAAQQGAFAAPLGRQANRIIPYVAIATIVLGFLRGTVWGDIKDVADLGTSYGILWLVGFVAAIATFALGWFILRPAGERLAAMGATGGAAAPAELARVQRYTFIELGGFIVIFTTMILMHFVSEA